MAKIPQLASLIEGFLQQTYEKSEKLFSSFFCSFSSQALNPITANLNSLSVAGLVTISWTKFSKPHALKKVKTKKVIKHR